MWVKFFVLGSVYPVVLGVYQWFYAVPGQINVPLATLFSPRLTSDDRLRWGVHALGENLLRISSTLGTPTAFGEYLAIVLIMVLALVWWVPMSWPWALAGYAYSIIVMLLIISTFSRSAWPITLFGLMMLVAVTLFTSKRFSKILLLTLAMVLAAAASLTLVPAIVLGYSPKTATCERMVAWDGRLGALDVNTPRAGAFGEVRVVVQPATTSGCPGRCRFGCRQGSGGDCCAGSSWGRVPR